MTTGEDGAPPRRRRGGNLEPWVPAVAAVVGLGACLVGAGPAAAGAAAAPDLTYRLAQTIADRPRASQAGRFQHPDDVTSDPAGNLLVLDHAYGVADPAKGILGDAAVHLFDATGTPIALWPIGDMFQAAVRLDGAPDGSVAVLGSLRSTAAAGVVRLAADGSALASWALPAGRPMDVGVAPDGTVYVSIEAGPGRVAHFDPGGEPLGLIVPGAMGAAGPGDEFAYRLSALDVADDGTLYVAYSANRNCPGPPLIGTATPTRTPTPRPSAPERPRPGSRAPAALRRRAPLPADPLPCAKAGVLEFDATGQFVAEHQEGVIDDIAARGGRVFVSRGGTGPGRPPQQVFDLGVPEPAYTYRTPRRLGSPVDHSAAGLQLDVAVDDTVRAVTGVLAPFYRGAVAFATTVPPAPGIAGDGLVALGNQDAPPMMGPTFPLRVAAGHGIVVLEGPHQQYVLDGPVRTGVTFDQDVSALQHWSKAGELLWQSAHFGNLRVGGSQWNNGGQLVDLAVDGADTFAISSDTIWYRPDALPPVWYQRADGARFGAVAADDGMVAVLEIGGGRGLVYDRRGRLQNAWMLEGPGANRLVVDLALYGDRIYLADEGRNVIVVRKLSGVAVGDWSSHDGPRAVATGPDGDVFVLGRSGYGLRYRPDGELVAAWRLPTTYGGVPVEGRDIAVDEDGRVVVSFLGLAPPDGTDREDERRGYVVAAGGLWIFEPTALGQGGSGSVLPGACLAAPDKTARPTTLLLGEDVTVDLAVDGFCPGRHAPQQLMIVFDTSYSMANALRADGSGGTALSRAQALVDALLASLDADAVELGLVTFSDGAALDVPLPGDPSGVRGRVARLVADGDTRMGAGIAMAAAELTGPAGDATAQRTILIVSDGVFKDDPAPAARAAAAANLDLAVFVVTTTEFDDAATAALRGIMAGRGQLFVDPSPAAATSLIGAISTYIPNLGLFAAIRVLDVVPPNMRYVDGSALPAAAFDPATRTLSWDLGPMTAAEGVRLRYRLVPQQLGRWPTNVDASAAYTDVLGHPGTLDFPVPAVDVLAPLTLATPVPSPTPTATPLPIRSRIYLPQADNESCVPRVPPRNIVLVMDVSHTMSFPAGDGPATKLDAAKAAASHFVPFLGLPRDRVGLVAFDATARTDLELTGDRARAEAAIDALKNGWGTRVDRGLTEATGTLVRGARPGARTVVIVLSDGLQNGDYEPVYAAAAELKRHAEVIYTIGLGPDVDAALLSRVASSPDHYLHSATAGDLESVYRQISVALDCG